MIRPTPMQSTNITHNKNLTQPKNPKLRTRAKPMDEAQRENARRTRNAGSSLAH
uniref:Uncharacterized protein n=1 Tax=Arion vulgaris TaxID=1028688 RepID=A0A0B6ZC42_9EUPU